jgi:hypothetical protein
LKSDLKQYGKWHVVTAISLKVPGILRHIMLRFHRTTRFEDEWTGIHARDPIQELVGRSGQTGNVAPRMIEFLVERAKTS